MKYEDSYSSLLLQILIFIGSIVAITIILGPNPAKKENFMLLTSPYFIMGIIIICTPGKGHNDDWVTLRESIDKCYLRTGWLIIFMLAFWLFVPFSKLDNLLIMIFVGAPIIVVIIAAFVHLFIISIVYLLRTKKLK